jgi:hypothetical protein
MTAFTTTPICNLRQPGADVGLPRLLPASLGNRVRMARKSAKFGSQFGDYCNGATVGAAVRVCRCPWLQWLPRQVTCRPDFRAHSAQDHESLGPPCYYEGATVRTRSGVGGPPPYPARGARLGTLLFACPAVTVNADCHFFQNNSWQGSYCHLDIWLDATSFRAPTAGFVQVCMHACMYVPCARFLSNVA